MLFILRRTFAYIILLKSSTTRIGTPKVRSIGRNVDCLQGPNNTLQRCNDAMRELSREACPQLVFETQCDIQLLEDSHHSNSDKLVPTYASSYQYEDNTSIYKYIQIRRPISHVSTTHSQHGANKIKFRLPFPD